MSSLAVEPTRVNWKFGLGWLLVTIAGLAVSLVAMFAGVGEAINTAPILLFGAVLGGVFGLGCGMAQWLVLRRQLGRSGGWIAATFFAWTLFWALNLADVFGHIEGGFLAAMLEGLIHGALFGGLLGLSQWIVLRQRVPQAGWWFVISLAAWSISAAIGDGIKAGVGADGPLELVIALLVATLITGAALSWLLRLMPRKQSAA